MPNFVDDDLDDQARSLISRSHDRAVEHVTTAVILLGGSSWKTGCRCYTDAFFDQSTRRSFGFYDVLPFVAFKAAIARRSISVAQPAIAHHRVRDKCFATSQALCYLRSWQTYLRDWYCTAGPARTTLLFLHYNIATFGRTSSLQEQESDVAAATANRSLMCSGIILEAR